MTPAELQELLSDLAASSGVLGASVAVIHDGRTMEAATGRMRIDREDPVTTSTPFTIGSTSKAFTATLISQLVAEGRLAFDDRVVDVLPEAAAVAGEIRVRHLLGHTSGLDNGPYADQGMDADAVARYVAALDGIAVNHPPGERFGYSNAAYVIAGRIVEVLTDQPWDVALARRILGPAGLTSSFTWDGGKTPAAAAHGHRAEPDGSFVVAPAFSVSGRAMGPTGSTLCCTAADLARFGVLHLDDSPLLDVEAELPAGSSIAHAWTMGFLVERFGGVPAYGHTGHTMGAGSYLRFVPSESFVFALVFNSPGDSTLYHELSREVFGSVLGLEKADAWVPVEDVDIDLSLYEGTYRVMGTPLEIVADDGGLRLGGPPELGSRTGLGSLLRPANRSVFGTGAASQYTVAAPEGALTPDVIFDDFDEHGRPRFALATVFLFPRIN